MCEPSLPLEQTDNRKPWLEKIQALLEVLLLSGLFSSMVAAVPFTLTSHRGSSLLHDARLVACFLILEASITLVLLAVVMKLHGESLRDFGLRWKEFRTNCLIGLAVVPVLFMINLLIAEIFRVFFPNQYSEHNPLVELIRTRQDLLLFILSGLYAGGIKEELQRAFILTRFKTHLGGAITGLILWSLVFGAGHYLQGMQGVAAATAFGMLFGIIYLARGNLIPPMVAHGLYDTAALLAFWFFVRSGHSQ